jgi:hypothetical protein
LGSGWPFGKVSSIESGFLACGTTFWRQLPHTQIFIMFFNTPPACGGELHFDKGD